MFVNMDYTDSPIYGFLMGLFLLGGGDEVHFLEVWGLLSGHVKFYLHFTFYTQKTYS